MKIKIKKPNYVILLSVLIIIIAIVTAVVLKDKSIDISQILTIATALVGVVSLSYEMSRTKNIAEAEFLVGLNTNFVNNPDYRDTYDLLENYDFENLPDIDLPNSKISNYLTFFETFQLLIERGVLKIEMVDDLFGYRFFLAVHNPYIQRVKLVKSPRNFKNIYKLEKKWTEYRTQIGKVCFHEEYALEKQVDETTYKEIIDNGKKR